MIPQHKRPEPIEGWKERKESGWLNFFLVCILIIMVIIAVAVNYYGY